MPAPRSRSAAASRATSSACARRARRSGPDKLLLVDINGAYTPDVALECARAIEPFGIHWIEEPLPPGDLRGYAELRARSPIPIAAGEAHHTVRDFQALIDGRCIDIVQPSIPGVGGLTEAKRIATLAQAAEPAGGAACLGRRRRAGDGAAISSPRCRPRRIPTIRRIR